MHRSLCYLRVAWWALLLALVEGLLRLTMLRLRSLCAALCLAGVLTGAVGVIYLVEPHPGFVPAPSPRFVPPAVVGCSASPFERPAFLCGAPCLEVQLIDQQYAAQARDQRLGSEGFSFGPATPCAVEPPVDVPPLQPAPYQVEPVNLTATAPAAMR